MSNEVATENTTRAARGSSPQSTQAEKPSEVLFVGAVSASIIGYEVREPELVDRLAAKSISFSLSASATAPFPNVEESFSATKRRKGERDSCVSAPMEFQMLQGKPHSTGRLRFQRGVFVPVLLETDTLNEKVWREDRLRDAGNETFHREKPLSPHSLKGEEEEEEQLDPDAESVGYLSLATHLNLQLHLPESSGKSVIVPVASKQVRLRSLSHHAAYDLCSIVRVVITTPTLEGCCSAVERGMVANLDLEKAGNAPGMAGVCFSVLLRVLSLGHTIGAMVDADAELSKLLGPAFPTPGIPTPSSSVFRLLSRERTPYGSIPLSELYVVYRQFCEVCYYRRSFSRHSLQLLPAVWTSTPALRAAEQCFPYRWNALTDWGPSLDSKMLGDMQLTPFLLTLSHCTNLRHIRLPSNRVSDASCARLCGLFAHHRYLAQVVLPGNEIYESGADCLLRLVRRNRRLVELNLRENPCSDAIRRRIQKVTMQNETVLRQDPVHFFSSQYSYLVSPASLPKPVLREALLVWAQLTVVPIGDVDVWPRNSTTEDMDHYVDESILSRMRDAQLQSEATPSLIPLAARAALLSEVMRTVATAMQRVVADPIVRSLFTDVPQMEGRLLQRAGEEERRSASGGTESVGSEEVPPEVWTALQLQEEGKQAGPLMEADELYSISFLRIIVTTFRMLEHQYDWEEVVEKLRKVGQKQVELGVRMEDYWLAVHVFMRALQLSLEGGSSGAAPSGQPLLRPESISAVLAVLALAFRTALNGVAGLDH